uniref:FAD_binding_3 domain-containing protein n=1 Tax=Heterorhabditis bacteriophora TaxID=37862 RepID=A0A1I7XLY6_HETBA
MLLPSRSMYYMTLRQKSYFDTVIVGGGMVGNAMACVLEIGIWDQLLSYRAKKVNGLHIGADGVRSQVRDAMNIDYTGWNYEQSGVVATIVVETPSNNIAWQRFSPLGPIALLPLSQNLCSLVWSTSSDHAKELLALSPEHFIDKLNHALVSYFYVATRCALVGDSAHRVHPLAGQGVNLGWNDVILLTQLLERANRDGADIVRVASIHNRTSGSLTYLKDYDSVAQRHNVPILVSIDWLNRLYRTDSTPIVLLRSIGLSIVNATKPLKNILISRLSSPPTTPYH